MSGAVEGATPEVVVILHGVAISSRFTARLAKLVAAGAPGGSRPGGPSNGPRGNFGNSPRPAGGGFSKPSQPQTLQNDWFSAALKKKH